MKKTQILAIAALAAAVTFQTAAKAEDPVSPVQGAVCNLYLLDLPQDEKVYKEMSASLARQPAAATFADSAADFRPSKKQNGITSSWGMWTGWLKIEKAGTYTFLCRRGSYRDSGWDARYSIWINGVKCLESAVHQSSFNVDLNAGFNSVKIIADSYDDENYPLTITYKKAGGLKDPVSFGPSDMFYDDEE